MKSHEPRIQAILEDSEKYKQYNPGQEDEIQSKCDHLSEQWKELNELASERFVFKEASIILRYYAYIHTSYSVYL